MDVLAGPRERPPWFDRASRAVLAGAGTVLAAGGPRELEQATVDLLGGQVRAAVRGDGRGLWFEWWLRELTGLLAGRVERELAGGGPGWQAPWWLLHGLTSIGSPPLAETARQRLGKLARRVAAAGRHDPDGSAHPAWLYKMPRITATGQVWQLRDVYGTRIGILAGFTYPGQADRSVFLFDIDACGVVVLAEAGSFDDVAQAAAAWRTTAGAAADGAEPRPVQDPEQLQCMVQWDRKDEFAGSESDSALDNLFRARRRFHDLEQALWKQQRPLPAPRSLFRDRNTAPMVDAFTAWYAARQGTPPDHTTVRALAEEWLEGCLPGTEHAASPHRIRVQRALIGDWIDDDPITLTAKVLLPEWARWHAEQADLPDDLTRHAVAVAAGQARTADCGPKTL